MEETDQAEGAMDAKGNGQKGGEGKGVERHGQHGQHGNYGKNEKDGNYGKNPSRSSQPAQGPPPAQPSQGPCHPQSCHDSHTSHSSHSSRFSSHSPQPPYSPAPEPLLPPRGDYRTLLSFQKAEAIYDITFRFAHKFLSKGDRTINKMIQSARSGKKNILEGSKAGVTSKETEIKLTNVARASLEELLDDYYDFLRARDLRIWEKDSKEARYVRDLGRRTPQTFEIYREFVETRPAEVVANIALCLIHQTNYLLDRQLSRLGQDFVEQGGLRERMTRVRLERRNRPSIPPIPLPKDQETQEFPPKTVVDALANRVLAR